MLNEHFPGRLTSIWGSASERNSSVALANPVPRCDFVVVDGGRSHTAVASELKAFAGMVKEDHLLTLDDTPCSARRCRGPAKAWAEFLEKGCLAEEGSVRLSNMHGFSFGRYRNCSLWGTAPAPDGKPEVMSVAEVSSAGSFKIRNKVNVSYDHRVYLDGHLLTRHASFWTSPATAARATAKESRLESLLNELEATVKANETVLEGHVEAVGELAKQANAYDAWIDKPGVRTICETGFNAGHSALRFLSQSKANVIEFDDASHKYALPAAKFLSTKFPGRMMMVWGDSKTKVPEFHGKHPNTMCDIIIVDGGRDFSTTYEDLGNFAQMASRKHVLALDDTPCSAGYCMGPAQAWRELVEDGCIEEDQAIPMGPDRGFTTGRFISCKLWPDLVSERVT
jgi:hypothetical protein